MAQNNSNLKSFIIRKMIGNLSLICLYNHVFSLSFKWNLIRLGGPSHGIVTKTVHKVVPGGGGIKGLE